MTNEENSPKIFVPIKDALQGMVTGFLEGSKQNGEPIDEAIHQPFLSELVTAFYQLNTFEAKLASVDEVFANYPVFEPLQEFCFDLFMVNFFAADSKDLGEGYLESAEWMAIEERILDRGSEFLNLLLYINESKETEATISLDDFLKEFLLTEDDLYQDEFVIYEPIIKNQHLVDADIKDILETTETISDDEIKEVYAPLMTYFNTTDSFENRYQELVQLSHNKTTDAALLLATQAFTESLDTLIAEEE